MPEKPFSPEMLLAWERADVSNSGQSSGSRQAMLSQEGQQAGHFSSDLDGISSEITKKLIHYKTCLKINNKSFLLSIIDNS